MELHSREEQGQSDGALPRSDGGDQRADDMVTRQMRRRGGIPDGIYLGHAAKLEWRREDVVDLGRTFSLWKNPR